MKKQRETHYDRVLRHLQENGSITSWESIIQYGLTRLGAYIYLLRKDGYNIESKTICTKNRFGESSHFVKYVLKGGVDEKQGN